ncbi:MAG: RNA 2',3'-cyclic phosphodiesterase [Thaumarchaeota archaeon]|nr:RNA 2',3'-cyclic phosphodiesterase [Nitrososphaerota archaeon]
MRAFVALEIPEPKVIEALVAVQDQLAETDADLKMVERQNLHFTIKFLGVISDAEASEADSRLKRLSLPAPEVEVKGLGAFPNPSSPRVIWVGLAGEHESLVAPIAKGVIQALEGIGERDDRPFVAHVTLARSRSRARSPALASLLRSNAGQSFGTTKLTTLKLKSSKLTPQGPVYSDIGVYPLA